MLADSLKSPETLLSFAPEELGQLVLAEFVARASQGDNQLLNRHNFFNWLNRELSKTGSAQSEALPKAFAEAWSWLQAENLLATDPGQGGEWVFVSRRGLQAASPQGFAAFRNSNLLPKTTLHPALVTKVWPTFVRGDFDTALFQAFREVEIAVREAAVLPDTTIGVNLMRRAFGRGGALEDAAAPDGERDGLVALFSGAVATYKNPVSHRDVNLRDPAEAAELIGFASQLLRIVDRRKSVSQA